MLMPLGHWTHSRDHDTYNNISTGQKTQPNPADLPSHSWLIVTH